MSGTTYTPSLRFAIMTPGDPAVKDQWGQIRDNTITLYEQSITGNTPINIAGLTSYTLTTNNNAVDEARQAWYVFTGALTGNCSVTLPQVPKTGIAFNNTSGGFSVELTTGAGGNVLISPGFSIIYTCDGNNIGAISLELFSLLVNVASATSLFFGTATSTTLQSSASYANDAAAAVGGVAVGQFYRNGSVVQIRVS